MTQNVHLHLFMPARAGFSAPRRRGSSVALRGGASWPSRWGIYYLNAVLRWDRGPTWPDQAVLIDLAASAVRISSDRDMAMEFLFRGRSADHGGAWFCFCLPCFGRVWLGYACPQTVLTICSSLSNAGSSGDRNARCPACITRAGRTQTAGLRVTKMGAFGLGSRGDRRGVGVYFTDAPQWPGIWFTLDAAPGGVYDHRDP